MSMPPKPPGYYTDKLFTCDDMDKAIQKEREECAKICETYTDFDIGNKNSHAILIRARGQE